MSKHEGMTKSECRNRRIHHIDGSFDHSSFVIISSFVIPYSSFPMLNNPASDTLDLGMMREHVNTSITATKKST